MSRLGFLDGGGETGELIRNYDWEQTPLGKIENWPVSLKSTVGIVLHSAFPQYLFWGDDLITFYNDPLRPSLGNDGKHPAIGKKGKDIWPEIWDFVGPLIEKVMVTGEPVFFEDQLVPFYRNGKMEDIYFTFSYSPAYGDDGKIAGVFVTCPETTNSVLATKELQATQEKIEKSQEQLLSYFEQSPVAIATISKENLTFRLVNSFYAELVGRTPEQLIDKPLLEALPEIKEQGFAEILENVIGTGVPFIAEEVAVNLKRKGVLETVFVNVTYQPQRDIKDEIIGILVVATDVSQQVQSRKKVEGSEARFRSLIEEAPVATCLFVGRELTIAVANNLMLGVWGKSNSVIGKRLEDAVPELRGQPFLKILDDVFTSGKPYSAADAQAELEIDGVLGAYYFNFTYKPLFDEAGEVYGIIDMAVDVTEQVLSRQKIEENEAHLQLTRDAVPAMIFYMDAEQRYRSYNHAFMSWFKVNATEALGKTTKEFIGDAAYSVAQPYLAKAYAGERVEYHMHAPKRIGGEKWLNIVYTPDKKPDGTVVGIIVHATDITEHMLARQKIEAKEKELRELIAASPIGICVLAGRECRVEEVNDRYLTITGRTREQMIGKIIWDITIGSSNVFKPIMEAIFDTGIKYTSEETKIEVPRAGAPGTIYITFEYIPVFDSNNIVIKIIVIVVEVTEQVETRKVIERAVVERTKELADSNLRLKRSNEELEQFAYIASHDLQEPIRKISTFTQMLEHSLKDISAKSQDYISKIYNSTDRMTKLIRDVLAFSRIKEQANDFEQVDLAKIIDTLKVDYEFLIEETQATIETSGLPVIEAVSTQMIQLFSNLMSNSLKYKKPDVKPIIKIMASIAKPEKIAKRITLDKNKKYYHIEFSDNGIGFDKDYVDRIFKIFQRLHGKTEFEGTGIGLAICLRIVQNHQGHIAAAVGENGGAVFNILLPVNQDLHEKQLTSTEN